MCLFEIEFKFEDISLICTSTEATLAAAQQAK